MTLCRVALESFEGTTTSPPKQSVEYLRGFEEGTAEAARSNAAALTQAIGEISVTLSDMSFGYNEARVLILDRIRPLLTQVAETILPEIARESFASHLVSVLTNDFEVVAGVPIQILVNPAAADRLSDVVSQDIQDFVFVSEPTLTDGQAVLKNSDTHLMIDLPALVLALQMALNGLEPIERIQSNDR